MKSNKTPNRKYRPRTEAQKERRRYLDRLRREKAKKELNKKSYGVKCVNADKVKKMLKSGKVVTPKSLKGIVSKKAKGAKDGVKKVLREPISLTRKHVVHPGDAVVFVDFTVAGITDFAFRLLRLGIAKMMSDNSHVIKA